MQTLWRVIHNPSHLLNVNLKHPVIFRCASMFAVLAVVFLLGSYILRSEPHLSILDIKDCHRTTSSLLLFPENRYRLSDWNFLLWSLFPDLEGEVSVCSESQRRGMWLDRNSYKNPQPSFSPPPPPPPHTRKHTLLLWCGIGIKWCHPLSSSSVVSLWDPCDPSGATCSP